MKWTLELAAGPDTGLAIDPERVGPRDEFLCGQCGALLAVDHQLWQNSAMTGNGITCAVCGAENNPVRGYPEPDLPATEWPAYSGS